ncbi:MAG: hypothetical protein LC808_10885 [Actinobacteria bacterium]|nr:hypothetical protein [Actinomycetota bacterium]
MGRPHHHDRPPTLWCGHPCRLLGCPRRLARRLRGVALLAHRAAGRGDRREGRYLDLFGLSFGAFDFGVTSDGQWLAYKCNPSAQWLWLEHQTGIGISTALAEFLAAGATG